MTFDEWMNFETLRIVEMGQQAPEEHRRDYMQAQIVAALHKAFAQGRDGLGLKDEPRAVR